jgi:hypothetical protein
VLGTLTARHAIGVVAASLAIVATACSNGSSAASGNPTLQIVSPADGASITEPFALKVSSSVPLGAPSTGEHHVHLCFDGASCDTEYKLVYGNRFIVNGLSKGKHTIEASLRNADHSDTGINTMITVDVTATASGIGATGATGGSGGGGGGGGYGYGS